MERIMSTIGSHAPSRVLCVLIAVSAVFGSMLALSPASTNAAVVRTGGVVMNAPAGYRLRQPSGDAFVLSSSTTSITFFRVAGQGNAAAVGAAVRASWPKAGALSTSGGVSRFTAPNGRNSSLVVARAAKGAGAKSGQVDVFRMSVRSASRSRAAATWRAPNTKQQRSLLNLFAKRTAQPLANKLEGDLPMKSCSAGGATAQIPYVTGFGCDGAKGSFTTGKAGYGFASLGVPVYVQTIPTLGGTPVAAPFTTPEAAMKDVWPLYNKYFLGVTITNVTTLPIPGTEGIISGIPSQMVAWSATIAGAKYDGLAISAYLNAYTEGASWYWYSSVIGVDRAAPQGTGNAMLKTWSTWDASVAIRERLANIQATLASTATPASGIDPDAFQRAQDNWSSYIRD